MAWHTGSLAFEEAGGIVARQGTIRDMVSLKFQNEPHQLFLLACLKAM